MKLHVSAFISHHQVSTLIKKSLYKLWGHVDEEMSMHHSPFHSLSSLNAICKQRDSCIQLEVWRWGFSSWGCINSCGRVLLSCSSFLSLRGPLCWQPWSFPVGVKRKLCMKLLRVFSYTIFFSPPQETTKSTKVNDTRGPPREREREKGRTR